jgi:hypothetical protein
MFGRREKEPTVNPFLSRELASEHIRDLHDEAVRTSRGREKASAADSNGSHDLTVRGFAERDIDAIRRLAALDEKPIPTGGVLVAEQDGDLIAVLPLDGGQALADPFKPTADIVELLTMRARQLREASGGRALEPHGLVARFPLRKAA